MGGEPKPSSSRREGGEVHGRGHIGRAQHLQQRVVFRRVLPRAARLLEGIDQEGNRPARVGVPGTDVLEVEANRGVHGIQGGEQQGQGRLLRGLVDEPCRRTRHRAREAEGGGQGLGRGVPARGVLGEHLAEHGQQGFGNARGLGALEGYRLVDVLQGRGHRRGGAVGRMPGEDLVEHAAQAVDVAALVGLDSAGVLRAHVFGRAEQLPHRRDGDGARGAPALRDVHVHEACHAMVVQHHVLGLQVLVQQARVVHGLQARRHLAGQVEGFVHRQRGPSLQPQLQAGPAHALHHQEEQAPVFAAVADAANVAMVDGLGQGEVSAEGRIGLGGAPHVGPEHLDRHHHVLEPIEGAVHGRHRAPPEQAQHLVAGADVGAAADPVGDFEAAARAGLDSRLARQVASGAGHSLVRPEGGELP